MHRKLLLLSESVQEEGMEAGTPKKQKNNNELEAQEDGASVALAVEEATESELSSLPASRLLQFYSNKSIIEGKTGERIYSKGKVVEGFTESSFFESSAFS